MTNMPISILLVEDSVPDARYVQEMLRRPVYDVIHASSLSHAYDRVGERIFDVTLLDLSLPDSNGLETFESIVSRMPKTPIVILTGLDDEDVAIKAVQLGAQDYIFKKDISESTLIRTIRYSIERKQAEEKSKRLVVLEQREEFMATLTHDLKNPLIGANRLLELMAEQALGELSSEQSNLLLQLRDNNKMLLSMIQNLFEVYKFEKDVNAVHLENTNLLEIITACIRDIAPIAENRHIRLTTEFSDQISEVVADSSAIRRVMQNLLDNALKFTPNGGEIRLAVHPTNGSVAVQIGDTGPGISEEEQRQLFQRFSQGSVGKNYTPGTGLGLYLCKQIIEAHHGKISCSSKEGVGTTFSVILPAA